jgi:lactose/cellobiose-specific phosphotransferase system IIC component
MPQHSPPEPGFSLARLEGRLFRLFSAREAPLLRAFRHGLMLLMPLLLAAAIGLLFINFPLLGYKSFMNSIFGPHWKTSGLIIYNATIQVLALAAAFSLSSCFMDLHNQRNAAGAIPPPVGILTVFVCLVIMMVPTDMGTQGVSLPWAGIRGLFGTLLISCSACGLFLAFCRVPGLRVPFFSEGADPVLPYIFDTLLPALCTMMAFICLRQALSAAGIDNLHETFYNIIRAPFQDAKDSFGLGALYTAILQFCWFLGIHGADLLDPITHQILLKNMQLNSVAFNNHLAPSHIFSKYFFDVYIFMGGSGATLGLLAAIFLRSRDRGSRRVAFLSIIPSIFNINEPLLFGLPIVLNPFFLLPFIFVPLALLLVSYAAVASGIAPMPIYQVDWTTPVIVSAFISTDSWRGVALQVFNLTLATLMYVPFVGLADRDKLAERRKAFDELVAIAAGNTRGPSGKHCIDRPGTAGALARSLANDLRNSLNRTEDVGDIQLHYQPRVDFVRKKVPCVEALLRWQHPLYGSIPAVLTLAIAHDTGLSQRLDSHVLHMAFERQSIWRSDGIFTTISINLSENQLRDSAFPALLSSLYARYTLPADAILFEAGEALALDPEARYLPALQAIHATGVNIAVDDFGKGYQAISHIKRLPLSELQIDRALIRDIAANSNCQDVIGTIQELCLGLGIKTSAEYVENQHQLETLLELNFSAFQGYYFSMPVPADECKEFIRNFSA